MSADQEQSKLPTYSEMIVEAIESLKEKDGSSKTSISNYLESKYAERLAEGHQNLVTAHLARMVESGEIVLKNNNYTKASSGAGDDGEQPSAKRGRGRPPKFGSPASAKSPATTESGEKRGRGRPPKPKDPLVEASEKAAKGLPKPRGRPPKTGTEPASGGDDGNVAVTPGSGAKRGRGRPPKAAKVGEFADVGFA